MVILKKDKIKELSRTQKIFKNLYSAIAILWIFGLLFQFINSAKNNDYSMFKEYGMVALTIFGFTLIGGIFERGKNKPEIVTHLFDSSISFLTTAIAFYFMYSISSLVLLETGNKIQYSTIVIGITSGIAVGIGILGIVFGLLNLYQILITFRLTFEKNKS